MPLVSQAAYARRRGISRVAVYKRTVGAGGPIPTHGTRKLIDVAEADALWTATMSPHGAANAANGHRAPAAARAAAGTRVQLAAARADALRVELDLKRLALD